MHETLVAACVPNATEPPDSPVPVTVTTVPPAGGPWFGLTAVTTGSAV